MRALKLIVVGAIIIPWAIVFLFFAALNWLMGRIVGTMINMMRPV